MTKNIYMIGLGAVGCLYGHKIQEAFPDSFKVIADKDRINKYQTNGIIINNKKFDFNFLDEQSYNEPADVLFFAVKQYHLDKVIKEVKKYISDKTIIVSLLNGIESESILQNSFKKNKIIHSFCIELDAVRQENEVTYSRAGKIVFGDINAKNNTNEVEEIREIFEKSNVEYKLSNNILYEQWFKFLINVSINQFSAILNAPYGIFQNCDSAKELLRMSSYEVVELSRKVGVNLKDEVIDEFLSIIDILSPEGLTSMLQDVRASRKTEYEMLSGTVIKLANEYGLDVPINKVLYNIMSTKEFMNK